MLLRLVVLACCLSTALATGAPAGWSSPPGMTSEVATAAAGRPAYALVPAAGPLVGGPVTLRMRGSARPLAARIGKQPLELERRGKRWTVVLPPTDVPGVVAVQVKTAAGWSKRSAAARYEYVEAPRIDTLSVTEGPTTGGTEVLVSGAGLTREGLVTVSGEPATAEVTTDGRLRVVTPPGPEGPTELQVSTAGGTAAAAYRFVLPPAEEEAELVSTGTTQDPAQVQWVSSDAAFDDPEDPDDHYPGEERWVVSLAPGADVPFLDESFFLPPGSDVFPSGLAGVVADVASQVDGSTRVQVVPAPLTEVMGDMQIAYSGATGEVSEPGQRRMAPGDSSISRTVSFGKVRAPNFLCTDRGGETASFKGSLNLDFKDVHTSFHFDGGGTFHEPSLFAYVNAKPVISGEVTADAAMTCRLGPSWANAQRKVFPLGATGVTVSFGPRATFQISAAGTLSWEKRLRIMTGFSTNSRGELEPIGSSGGDEPIVRASGQLQVEVKAGLEIRIGLLDRVGVTGSAQLRAAVTARPDTFPSTRVCAELKGGVEFEVGAFLDLWVARWDYEAWRHEVPLVTWAGCLESAPAVNDDSPVITSARLPDAQDGEDYSTRLTTADNRPGRWSMVSGRLPTGLRLDPDNGQILGRPSGAVGEHVFTVGFVDGSARSARASVRLVVTPSEALGGGDVQVRLRWGSDADLDLHVIDPWGEEIYFANSIADSGGELDRDSNAACNEALTSPVENITWPRGTAPRGDYYVYVVVFDDCGTDDLVWDLQVSVGGRVLLTETGYGDAEGTRFSVGSSRRALAGEVAGHVGPGPTRGGAKPAG